MHATTGAEMPPLKDLEPIDKFLDVLGANRTTVIRWAKVGVKPGPIKLQAWLVNGWRTTETEVRNFIQRRTATKVGEPSTAPATSREIQKRVTAANEQLRRKGVKIKSK